MKFTKEEWKGINDRIMLALRPTQYPVAMKFADTQDDLDAIDNITYCQTKASVCKTIGMASHFQGTFAVTPDHFSGAYCAINNGCLAVDEEWLEGSILWKKPTPWHHAQEDAKIHIQINKQFLPETPFAGIVCSSLSDCDIEEPEVISLQLPSQAAFHLLAGFVESDYQQLQFNFSGESNCSDTWMRTWKEGKIGLSLGCRGDRATGGLEFGEVRVTMTAEQLCKALDGVDTVTENGIGYPYYPVCLYKDAF